MKKMTIIIMLLLLVCSACTGQKETTATSHTPSASPNAVVSETQQPRVTFEPWEKYEDVLPMISFDWVIHQSLEELVDKTDYIFVATVLDIEVFLYEDGEPNRKDDPLQDTMIKYTVRIDKPIKGSLKQRGTITVWQHGWRYNDVNIWHPDIPPLEYSKTYMLFLINNEHPIETLDIDYYVGMPYESYPEIKDDKLYPHPYSNLFTSGQSFDNIVFSITQLVEKKTALRDALIDLSAELGTKRLASCFSQDQVSVRELISDEMQIFFGFAGSDVVKETAGRELKNSDIFIWFKTNELTKTQQDELEAALTSVSVRIADERNWGYKVSVMPFHSLVCISRGEDRAIIHEAFYRILDEL